MSVTEALAFDMYGTLVDPMRTWKQLERFLPREAQRIAELWRQKQLEYTFRLTAMELTQALDWIAPCAANEIT